jgi:hypothetical protein
MTTDLTVLPKAKYPAMATLTAMNKHKMITTYTEITKKFWGLFVSAWRFRIC